MLVLATGIVAICIGGTVGYLATRKGRSFAPWSVYGTLLAPIALPHVLLLTDLYRQQAGDAAWAPIRFGLPTGTRTCPYCEAPVQEDAIACSRCRRPFYGPGSGGDDDEAETERDMAAFAALEKAVARRTPSTAGTAPPADDHPPRGRPITPSELWPTREAPLAESAPASPEGRYDPRSPANAEPAPTAEARPRTAPHAAETPPADGREAAPPPQPPRPRRHEAAASTSQTSHTLRASPRHHTHGPAQTGHRDHSSIAASRWERGRGAAIVAVLAIVAGAIGLWGGPTVMRWGGPTVMRSAEAPSPAAGSPAANGVPDATVVEPAPTPPPEAVPDLGGDLAAADATSGHADDSSPATDKASATTDLAAPSPAPRETANEDTAPAGGDRPTDPASSASQASKKSAHTAPEASAPPAGDTPATDSVLANATSAARAEAKASPDSPPAPKSPSKPATTSNHPQPKPAPHAHEPAASGSRKPSRELMAQITAALADASSDRKPDRASGGGHGVSRPAARITAIGDLVKKVQRELEARGLQPGPVDGKAGPQTRRAVRAYQRRMELPPTGEIDKTMLIKMGLL